MTIPRVSRALAVLALAGGGLLAAAPLATADGSPVAPVLGVPSAADLAAAGQAAKAAPVVQTLGGFFAHDGNAPAAAARPLSAAAPQVVGATVPVYYLNPDFVAASSSSAAAPVAKLAFAATEARSADGRKASVWTAPDPHGSRTWVEINIASGSDETDQAAAAAALGPQAVAFEEPQIRAWYALVDGQVRPLNPDAVRSVGADGITLDQYRQLVHDRYADKLPGTDYANAHLLGGLDRGSAAPVKTLAADSAPARGSVSPGTAGVLAAVVAVAGALGLGGLLRRRRAATRTTG
ncbi:hypothetical protein [Kitasatospora sp. NPDC094011]|uniref:hypothetical protein n=1 Tax=Kitasatospora sp. NPDC094011 TaxID=3364090 RepID=UPI0037FCFF9D